MKNNNDNDNEKCDDWDDNNNNDDWANMNELFEVNEGQWQCVTIVSSEDVMRLNSDQEEHRHCQQD